MKKKILIVDDEELLTRTFVRLLERQAYEVITAVIARVLAPIFCPLSYIGFLLTMEHK